MEKRIYMKESNTQASSLPLIYEWITNSWKEMKVDTIVESFKKCGTSNELDGTDDYRICEMTEMTEKSGLCATSNY